MEELQNEIMALKEKLELKEQETQTINAKFEEQLGLVNELNETLTHSRNINSKLLLSVPQTQKEPEPKAIETPQEPKSWEEFMGEF